ncbi:hypothetical protein UA75_20000 [Actinoalloteichus sp. GBA129-24]|uniref:Uncharacterized protein n=1 Tax=Actinoalloteichus fjordicus TaxID=1612552 RepID=A0AAC9LE19_9PSEU|nr:hypothetical protein UA74_19510 [Actinoalloteichus fjordicus]APU21989.1 hypothetical protein UA75_20000 [Actinoalloteichus sp. GBA129-24]
MTTRVMYTPQDRVLDLSRLTADDYQVISSLHSKIQRRDRVLLCLEPAVPGEDEMFVREIRGRYFAVHFPGGGHGSHEIMRESDEHRRQKEYWQRAAEDAGYPVQQEFATDSGTVLDVAIHGPRRTGVEVQRSHLTGRAAATRTTRSFRAGWLPVWFADSDRTPQWFHRVPSVGCVTIPWRDLPPRRAATATGLRTLEAERCTADTSTGCYDRRRRPCGRYHPKPVPWRGLTVDDVATLVPAEEAVPLTMRGGSVYLVPPPSVELFRELTGDEGEYRPGSGRRSVPPSRSGVRDCRNPSHVGDPPPGRWPRCRQCGKEIYLIREGRDHCEGCVPMPRAAHWPFQPVWPAGKRR